AYFQQGRADEFTRQKPEARKRILGDILDLKRYDRLSELAKRHRDECAAILSELEGEIRVLEARMADEPHLKEQLVQQETILQERLTLRDQKEIDLKAMRERLAAAEEKSRRLNEADTRL